MAGATPTGAAPAVATAHPGGSPVELGISYVDTAEASALFKAAGYNLLATGDPYAEARALVAWLNAHGGLAGHPVVGVYVKQTSGTALDTLEQQACAAWTQDHRVAAAIYPQNFSPDLVLPTCLSRAHVILTGGGDAYLNGQELSSFNGYLTAPYMLAADRMAQALVDRLVAQGWLSSATRIGVVRYDGAPFATAATVAARQLARYGLSIVDQATIASSSTDCQSVGLRFSTDHISRILVFDQGAAMLLACAPTFKVQGYYPEISITSYDSPSTVQSLIPHATLHGSAGVAWEPVNDVSNPTLNPAGTDCVRILSAAGQAPTQSALAEALAFSYCDGVFFLRQAYAAAGSLAPDAVVPAINGLGSAYLSPLTQGTTFGPGRYDGVGAVTDLTFDDGCGCYRYTGGLHRVP